MRMDSLRVDNPKILVPVLLRCWTAEATSILLPTKIVRVVSEISEASASDIVGLLARYPGLQRELAWAERQLPSVSVTAI